MDSLLSVVNKLKLVDIDIAALESCLCELDLDADGLSITDIQDYRERIEKLADIVEEFSDMNDSVEATNDDEVVQKRDVELTASSYSSRLEELTNELNVKRSVLAEKKKNLGNEQFKQGKFPAALALYEEAISCDPSNAVFYTNRALVLQKMDKWAEALADAEFAVSLDCDMLKGHVILIKCQVCVHYTDN
jgi:tetratricopeptide (TPR) repeat protein